MYTSFYILIDLYYINKSKHQQPSALYINMGNIIPVTYKPIYKKLQSGKIYLLSKFASFRW